MPESMSERIDMNDDVNATDMAGCPMHAIHDERPALAAEDELVFPYHKRVVAQYATDASGSRELHLYYGKKEISFDEPELFAFGEALARSERFFARDAIAWGTGYEWPRIQVLLEQLLDEGILHRVDDHPSDAVAAHHGPRPSPLPPAESAVPRTWFECEAITRELTGHPLELGYLEAVVPIYRVAHIALDAEGRQVGEANVFPKPLRLNIPTEWRSLPAPGKPFSTRASHECDGHEEYACLLETYDGDATTHPRGLSPPRPPGAVRVDRGVSGTPVFSGFDRTCIRAHASPRSSGKRPAPSGAFLDVPHYRRRPDDHALHALCPYV